MSRFRMYRYTVEGYGTFPFDMLRFDGSYPATPEDSNGLDSQLNRKRRQVTLYASNDQLHWQPNAERWKSFLWRVTDVEEML